MGCKERLTRWGEKLGIRVTVPPEDLSKVRRGRLEKMRDEARGNMLDEAGLSRRDRSAWRRRYQELQDELDERDGLKPRDGEL